MRVCQCSMCVLVQYVCVLVCVWVSVQCVCVCVCPCDQNSQSLKPVGGCRTHLCVKCSVTDHGSADKCSKIALLTKYNLFLFYFKTAIDLSNQRSRGQGDKIPAFSLSSITVQTYTSSPLWTSKTMNGLEMEILMYIEENVNETIYRTIPKISVSCSVIF